MTCIRRRTTLAFQSPSLGPELAEKLRWGPPANRDADIGLQRRSSVLTAQHVPHPGKCKP